MAQGSHGTWDGIPPDKRVCAGCGAKIRITKDAPLHFDTFKQEVWHVACQDDWLAIVKPRRPDDPEAKAAEHADWDQKREREEHWRRTGADPYDLKSDPPQDRLYVDGEELEWPQ